MTKRVICLLMCLVLIKGVSLVSAQTPPVVQSKSLSTTTCTSSASAGCLIVATNDLGGSGIQITGTWMGTISFYWTNEDSASGTYLALTMIPNGSSVGVTSTTGNGGWTADVSGYRYVKIAFSAYTSGTAVVTLVRSHARSGGGGSSGPTGGGATQAQFFSSTISSTVPGFSFVGDTDAGFGSDSADRLVFITEGTRKWLLSSTALFPLTSNAMDFGASGNTVQNVFVGTSVRVGGTPASSGALRLGYGSSISVRNQANTADVSLASMGAVADDNYVEQGSNAASGIAGVKIYAGANSPNLTLNTSGINLLSAVLFANLGTPANGHIAYCSDCTIANPCAGAGTGAFAKRLNGVWVCN